MNGNQNSSDNEILTTSSLTAMGNVPDENPPMDRTCNREHVESYQEENTFYTTKNNITSIERTDSAFALCHHCSDNLCTT